MEQTAVEWLWDMLSKGEFINDPEELLRQAKAKERVQKAEEYLKGFKDGKEYQIKLDELTFGSNKQIMSTDIPITNKDKEELMEILNRMQRNQTFKSE
jgi:hypothetical protein